MEFVVDGSVVSAGSDQWRSLGEDSGGGNCEPVGVGAWLEHGSHG